MASSKKHLHYHLCPGIFVSARPIFLHKELSYLVLQDRAGIRIKILAGTALANSLSPGVPYTVGYIKTAFVNKLVNIRPDIHHDEG